VKVKEVQVALEVQADLEVLDKVVVHKEMAKVELVKEEK